MGNWYWLICFPQGYRRDARHSPRNKTETMLWCWYGGSVSPESADDVFNAEGVSGALVGGASLNANKFAAIVAAWERR